VELMTSGAFAQASGLSRKALRLYDELGLLHPARVDPDTLYRFYHPGQLEQARLVAWLRRLGMPLAVIRSVSGLEGGLSRWCPCVLRCPRALWCSVRRR
jgi:protein phosphatase